MNLCRACDEDFASVGAFDRHRVGVHAYTFAEGLRQEPPVEDGRRCLSPEEMLALKKPLAPNARGQWHDVVDAARAREAFSQLRPAPRRPSEGQGGV